MKIKIYSAVLLLIAIEFLLQMVSLARYLYFNHVYTSQQSQRIADNWFFRNKKNKSALSDIKNIYFSYHPFLGWLAEPIQRESFTISSENIRRTGDTIQPDTTTSLRDIYIFGGSTIWGTGVSDSETIPSYVAARLNALMPVYRITNFGQIAFNTNQELLYLLLQLKNRNPPDTVIFYDGCNELFYNSDNEPDISVSSEKKLRGRMGNIQQFFQPEKPVNLSVFNDTAVKTLFENAPEYIKLYSYPHKIYSKLLSIIHGNTVPPEYSPDYRSALAGEIVQNYESNARTIEALSKAYGFRYVLIWQPLIFSKSYLSSDEKKLLTYSSFHPDLLYQIITRKLKEANIHHFYDGTEIFNNERQSLFFDSCHVSPEGNQIISKYIADILQRDYQYK